ERSFRSSRLTQPEPLGMLCSALRLSPSTSTGPLARAGGAASSEPDSSTSASRASSRPMALPVPNFRITEPPIDTQTIPSIATAIEVRSVGKSAAGPEGEVRILDGVDLTVAEGDSVAIVGASGSGKTTLLGLLAGLDLPTTGSISLAGQRLDQLDEEARAALRAREVGFVFQSFHLLPSLTAEENVALPLELAGREDPSRVAEVLAAVGLEHRRRHHPRQLSGGAWPWPRPSSPGGGSCSPPTPPATSTRPRASRPASCCSRSTPATPPPW